MLIRSSGPLARKKLDWSTVYYVGALSCIFPGLFLGITQGPGRISLLLDVLGIALACGEWEIKIRHYAFHSKNDKVKKMEKVRRAFLGAALYFAVSMIASWGSSSFASTWFILLTVSVA